MRLWIRLRIRFLTLAAAALLSQSITQSAMALNYNELEVYNYEVNEKHELSLENSSSASSGLESAQSSSMIFRTTLETTYGLTDKTDLAIYLDGEQQPDDTMRLSAVRLRARTLFFERDQLPINVGAYLEGEFPNSPGASWATEARVILDKSFGRLNLALNPALEINNESNTINSEYHLGASASYVLNSVFKPHLDVIHEFTVDASSLLLLGTEVKLGHALVANAGAGFGLTPGTERRLVATRLEYTF